MLWCAQVLRFGPQVQKRALFSLVCSGAPFWASGAKKSTFCSGVLRCSVLGLGRKKEHFLLSGTLPRSEIFYVFCALVLRFETFSSKRALIALCALVLHYSIFCQKRVQFFPPPPIYSSIWAQNSSLTSVGILPYSITPCAGQIALKSAAGHYFESR